MGRSGSGSVGKGGREANYAPPVDQYRRRIARQDSKKEKQHLKDVKHAQETKDVAPKAVKQIVSKSPPISKPNIDVKLNSTVNIF